MLIHWEEFFSDSVTGCGSNGLTSLRAFSRYTTNRIGLRLSPWGVPILLVNFFSSLVPPILIFRQVLLRRNRTNLSSSSSMMVSSMLRRVALSIVSKTADMSIPVIVMCSVFAGSHLCFHATSAVLLFGWKPLWLWEMYFSTCGLILSSTIVESVFRMVCSRQHGWHLMTPS